MVTSRGAFFLGLSLIVCTSIFIYGPQIGKFRYLTIPTNQGLFILDTKNQVMNVCTDKSCRVVPHEVNNTFIPGMQPTYGQMPMVPTNSLGIVENNVVPGFNNCGNGMCVMPVPQHLLPVEQPKPAIVEEKSAIAPVVMASPQQPVNPAPIAAPPQRIVEPRPVVVQPTIAAPTQIQRPTAQPIHNERFAPINEPLAPRPIATPQPSPQIRPITSASNPNDIDRINEDMKELDNTEQKLLG